MKNENSGRGIIKVVAALFWRHGRVLVQQRPANKALPLLWEFPGGKVEPGESDVVALQRECEEELGVSVQVGERVWTVQHDYGDAHVELCIYATTMADDVEPLAHAAAALTWRLPATLTELEFCPADVPLVEDLVAGRVIAHG